MGCEINSSGSRPIGETASNTAWLELLGTRLRLDGVSEKHAGGGSIGRMMSSRGKDCRWRPELEIGRTTAAAAITRFPITFWEVDKGSVGNPGAVDLERLREAIGGGLSATGDGGPRGIGEEIRNVDKAGERGELSDSLATVESDRIELRCGGCLRGTRVLLRNGSGER